MERDNPARSPETAAEGGNAGHSVCPWWLGYLLASPIRRWLEDPERILGPLVKPGMTVLEPGSGMGFFSLPLARMVGPTGTVVCVDRQPRMIEGLRRRAGRAGLADRIACVACGADDLGCDAWAGRVDLAVAIHMVHEVPDAAALLRQLRATLRGDGRLYIREPAGHVTPAAFEATLAAAEAAGFNRVSRDDTGRSLSAVLAVRS